jgi:hypothetical protein
LARATLEPARPRQKRTDERSRATSALRIAITPRAYLQCPQATEKSPYFDNSKYIRIIDEPRTAPVSVATMRHWVLERMSHAGRCTDGSLQSACDM